MRSRITIAALAQTVSLIVVVGAIATACGSRPTASTTTKAPARFTARAVKEAFASVGLALHNPAPSGSSPHLFATVTMLTSVRTDLGWTIAAYVYPTTDQATSSFSQDAGEWSASGIASVQVKNVVVVVVPRHHSLSRKEHVFAMPKVVYTALHALTGGQATG